MCADHRSNEIGSGDSNWLRRKSSDSRRNRKTKAAKKHAKKKVAIKQQRVSDSLREYCEVDNLIQRYGSFSKEVLEHTATFKQFKGLRKLSESDAQSIPEHFPRLPAPHLLGNIPPEIQQTLVSLTQKSHVAFPHEDYNMGSPNFVNPFLFSSAEKRNKQWHTPRTQSPYHYAQYPSPTLPELLSDTDIDMVVSPKTIPPATPVALSINQHQYHRPRSSHDPEHSISTPQADKISQSQQFESKARANQPNTQISPTGFTAVPFDLTDEVATQHGHWPWVYNNNLPIEDPPWLFQTPASLSFESKRATPQMPRDVMHTGSTINQRQYLSHNDISPHHTPVLGIQQRMHGQNNAQTLVGQQIDQVYPDNGLRTLDDEFDLIAPTDGGFMQLLLCDDD